MLKIAVGGALGRMGRSIVQLSQADPEIQLVASVVRPSAVEQASESQFPVYSNPSPLSPGLEAVSEAFDVFIDFSHITCFSEHLELCARRKQAMVIGITGLNTEQKKHMLDVSQTIPIVYSPNMSIAVNVSFKLLEIAAQVLNDKVGVAIHDIHHRDKKDSPSGTALKMGEIIARAWGKELPLPEIDFSSNRVAEVKGDHTVLFALEDERLEIRHQAENRSLFARGALRAAKWLANKPAGLYDMQDVLSLKI